MQLKSALSDDIDVDLVEAISNMTARQYALQASLQTSASIAAAIAVRLYLKSAVRIGAAPPALRQARFG